jgi:hypothetical protein
MIAYKAVSLDILKKAGTDACDYPHKPRYVIIRTLQGRNREKQAHNQDLLLTFSYTIESLRTYQNWASRTDHQY